jgi:hypothetical protein
MINYFIIAEFCNTYKNRSLVVMKAENIVDEDMELIKEANAIKELFKNKESKYIVMPDGTINFK